MSMIALSLSLELLILKILVLNMVLILKFLLDTIEPLLPILMLLKKNGTCIMNLLKIVAWKMKMLLMIAINMLKLLKVLFLISMLIFVVIYRPCEKNQTEEEYCITHWNEKN